MFVMVASGQDCFLSRPVGMQTRKLEQKYKVYPFCMYKIFYWKLYWITFIAWRSFKNMKYKNESFS